MSKDELSTANRKPGGRAYPTGTSGGVAYPVGSTAVNGVHEDEEQRYSILDDKGIKEHPDPTPMEPPLGYSAGPSLADFVQRTVRSALSQHAAEQDFETFEEAEDFDIEDDPLDPLTPYEAVFYGPKPSTPPEQPVKAEGRTSEPLAAQPAKPEGVAGEVVQPAPVVSTPNEKA